LHKQFCQVVFQPSKLVITIYKIGVGVSGIGTSLGLSQPKKSIEKVSNEKATSRPWNGRLRNIGVFNLNKQLALI
jgi:hypothetical protein